MHLLRNYCTDLLHLCFPHNCEGCGSDIVKDDQFLCARCVHRMPSTRFFSTPGNAVEKLFYGRLPLSNASAAFYFTKSSLLQHLVTQLKYKNNKEAGYFLGRMMGLVLRASTRFNEVDMLVPLPLHPEKEHSRGYNQAMLICEGISEIWKRPIEKQAVARTQFTETQTQQNRLSRWQNMEGVFALKEAERIRGRHILLVDDVITTGATLEACGAAILRAGNCSLSIAAAAYTL